LQPKSRNDKQRVGVPEWYQVELARDVDPELFGEVLRLNRSTSPFTEPRRPETKKETPTAGSFESDQGGGALGNQFHVVLVP